MLGDKIRTRRRLDHEWPPSFLTATCGEQKNNIFVLIYCDSKKNKNVCDLGGDEFYTKQDFLSKSFSIPTLLSSFLQGIYFSYRICQFVSELINKQKSRKSGISTIAENKLYAAHHKTQLHTMKVYNTRPVSLTIKVLLIKTVLFFNH